MVGRPSLSGSNGVVGAAGSSGSMGYHDRIVGEIRGRYWEIAPQTLSPLESWFTRGRPVLRASTWFRAAPPGMERSRDTPWVLLGPRKSRWDVQTMDEGVTRMFAEDRRGTKLDSIRVDGVASPLTAAASHPGLERSLRSPPWLDWYRSAYEITAPGGILGGRPAPTVVGMNCWLSLYAEVNFGRSPEEYARFIASFLEVVDLVEPGFEAPSPTQVPFAWRWDEPLPTVRWPMPEPMFTCPKCGALEGAAHFRNKRFVWKEFLISATCHEFLFRDFPPGVNPDAALGAARAASRS